MSLNSFASNMKAVLGGTLNNGPSGEVILTVRHFQGKLIRLAWSVTHYRYLDGFKCADKTGI